MRMKEEAYIGTNADRLPCAASLTSLFVNNIQTQAHHRRFI
jgi:hypothetical protein